MSEVLKTAASLSVSGSLLILVLLLCGPLWRDRLSRRWQYYIWLAVIARLLLPLSPDAGPVGRLFREFPAPAAAPYISAPVGNPGTPNAAAAPEAAPPAPAESVPVPAPEPAPVPEPASPEDTAAFDIDAAQVLTLVWLGGALFLLVRKVTVYQSFVRCIRAGCREVSDPALLDRLARAGERLGVRQPIELWENPLAASPMLLGVLRPRVVLPSADLPEEDFRYTVLHELTHCKRGDLIYKWLVQLTVCLHWFNPLVWLMDREIERACELACDEAVLQALEPEERRAYGGALLRALEAGGAYASVPGSATLGENAQLLKERLSAIMKFKKQSRLTAVLSLLLAAALATGAAAAGAYTGPAKQNKTTSGATASGDQAENNRLRAATQANQYYKEGNIAGFSIVLPFLNQEERDTFAKRAYKDGYVNFFSVLARQMDENTLDGWIDRASRDRKNAFLAMLLDETGRDEEKDALEEQWDAQQRAEYADFGVTWDGKDCYYNGQLVRIFLDARPNRSFFTLDTNPLGKVDIKIVRSADQQIQGVAYMTKEEVEELLGDWAELEEPVEMDTLDFRGTTYYLVFNEAQLRAIGSGQYGLDQHYLQQADIRLSPEEWVPIGTAERPFTGSYNGNGFEIKGLTMKDPEAKFVGLFGVGSGAEIYNVTLRDYDMAYAGRSVSQKAVGPVLAQGLDGSKCYDNFLYPKELNGGTVIHIPIDRKWVWDGEYCMLGEYTLSVGDRLQYDVSAETGNGLEIGFADMEHRPDEVSYATVSNRRQDGTLSCTADLSFGGHLQLLGRYRLFLHATDGELGNVKGSITLTLTEGDQDFPEIPPLTANDIQALTTDSLPAAAQKLLNQCAIRTWYLIHSEGRQYVWYNGFPGQYLYIPTWEDDGWKIRIQKRRQADSGYVLLSFPDGIPLSIIADGEAVRLTEIGK